ncbi:MAG: GDSL-type esterase/lipase family protein [Massilibacteroides sp.]|nr:GDSL-type esterase/lipase family protein [Massilibacteroides sp.]
MIRPMDRYNHKLRTLFFLLSAFTCSFGHPSQGQELLISSPLLPENEQSPNPADRMKSDLPFVIDSLIFIRDQQHSLNKSFEVLKELESGKDTLLTIVHLGDSHIQAGHYTGRIMRLLQQRFGNAGRGWIAPFKLSGTNEPDDYFIRSSAKEWIAGRITQGNKKTPIGPGGIGIKTISSSVNFDILIAPNNGAGYSFNQTILYRLDKSTPMLPTGTLKDSILTFRNVENLASHLVIDTFKIAKQTDFLQLHSTRRKPGTDSLRPASDFSNIYYGFSLTNGNPGVLYHAIGVNGAMFVNYTDSDFIQRLALLQPDLLIVSLGTNESFGSRFSENEFSNQIRDFLSLVKQYIPNTTLLLTTPAECYRRTRVNKQRVYVRNNNIQKVAHAITKLSEQEGIACWDMFSATGGKNSYKKWYQEKYMGRDRVHFSKTGYEEQGNLFYLAWIRTMKNKEKE